MPEQIRPKILSRKHARRLVLLAGATSAYGLTFSSGYHFFGPLVAAFAVFPAALSGWFYGVTPGFFYGAAMVIINGLLFQTVGVDALAVIIRSMPGNLIVVLSGPVLGLTARLVSRSTSQLEALKWERSRLEEYAAERRKAEEAARANEARLEMMLQQLPAIHWTTDRDLRLISGGGAALSLLPGALEFQPGEPLYRSFRSSDEHFPPIAAHLRALAGHASRVDLEWHGRMYQIYVEPFLDAEGLVAGTLGLAVDTTEQFQAQLALRESEERFRSAFDHAHIGMGILSLGGRWLKANRVLCAMLGYEEKILAGVVGKGLVHPEDAAGYARVLGQLADGTSQPVEQELRFRHRTGRDVWAVVSLSAVRAGDGRTLYLIAQVQDITDRKRVEAQLHHMASHDPLTGLPNRRLFREALERHLTESAGARGAVLYIDLDGFKTINDHLGHEAGDELLRDLAGLLKGAVNGDELVSRLGGDEFVLLLSTYSPSRVDEFVKHLQDSLRRLVLVVAGKPMQLTASVGIALFPDHGTSPEELLAHADLAMYQVKEGGQGGVSTYSTESLHRGPKHDKALWERHIRMALVQDRFVLHGQPILNMSDGSASSYELLLRMVGDQGELILPGAFLDTAEQVGLILDIDRWVVRRAIRMIADREEAGELGFITVNLSGKSLVNQELLEEIELGLAESGVPPDKLVFEITETAAVFDQELAGRFMARLKILGCKFALDDFGSGFASFHQLKHLAVDFIKIDGALIRHLPHQAADRHLVTAIVQMAHALGKATIAEFVESEETLAILRECGVDYAQGYFIGRPGAIFDGGQVNKAAL